jgi:hypothetical protein
MPTIISLRLAKDVRTPIGIHTPMPLNPRLTSRRVEVPPLFWRLSILV